MSFTPAERGAMARALELAATPGVPLGPNPRVGCVLLDDHGNTVGEGYHRGAGSPHAEVDALTAAGASARGSTAVVTLEPCNHIGRTGPCSRALIEAGVRRVVFAQPDPNPVAAGGAAALRDAGVETAGGLLVEEARPLNRVWTFAMEHGRPFVTWKFASTLDGRSAAADGTSRWVSSRSARLDTHRPRALCDVMLVGSNTVAVDDPQLTVRNAEDQPLQQQQLRVVMGERDLDAGRRIFNGEAPSLHLRTREPHQALAELFHDDRQHVFLEGGPTLAAAFLTAGLVDEIVGYVAPVLLGSGLSAVGELGITTIGQAVRPHVTDVRVLEGADGEEPNIRITMTPPRPGSGEAG